ncbi:ABC transporter permease [Aggregatilineales bacterium SYSU G02658]
MKRTPERVFISGLLRRGIVLLVLFVLAVYFSSQTDRFLQSGNLINILQQNAAVIIVSVGMTLTMLIGGIDLSVGSVAALSGAISAGLIVRNGVPFEVSVVLTLGMGFLIGLVNGGLIVYGKLPPFVATLAMLGIARGLTLLYTDGRPIPNIGDAYTFWGRGRVEVPVLGEVPAPIIVTVVVVLFFTWLMSQTRFGLYVYAIGGSEETTRLAGVNVNRIKLLTYGLSATLAALGGMLLTARLFSAQPQLAVGLELEAIAAAVLGGVSLFGGVGNVLGAVVGGLLIGVLTNGMNLLRVPSYQQQMVQGIALVGAVAIDVLSKRLERR